MPKQTLAVRQRSLTDTVVLFICCFTVFMQVLVALIAGKTDDLVRYAAWYAMLVYLLAMYMPARGFMRFRGGRETFGFVRISLPEWIYAFLTGVAMFFVVNALNMLLHQFFAAVGLPQALASMEIPEQKTWHFLSLILLMAIIPSYVEETLFRGILLNGWKPMGRRRAIWHTALIYALAQLSPAALPSTLLVGLLLGYVADRVGSCYASMGIQIGYSVTVLWIIQMSGGTGSEQVIPAFSEVILSCLLYIVSGAGLIHILIGRLSRSAARRLEDPDEDREERREQARKQETIELKEIRAMLDKWHTNHPKRGPQKKKTPLRIATTSSIATYVLFITLNLVVVANWFFGWF
ncbi:CPBP family intramembrane metalloprotease [Eubacteriales bacterium OttesenSCG-928-K08]|nr:CPBP family intramembrane metalloprotease [Eubacteriales bacterium OttesenSCG-928-K08]